MRPASLARFASTDCRIWRPKPGKLRISPASSLAQVYESCRIDNGAACPVGDWGTPLFTGDSAEFHAFGLSSGEKPLP